MRMEKKTPRSEMWLIIILMVGFLIRLVRIGSRSIIYDDAFTILLSRRPFQEIVAGTAADTMPPLFYFLLHIWGKVSQSIIWLRLLPILLSVLSIWLLFLIVKKVTSKEAALWAAGLAAISPILYYHAQDVRMYSLAVAFLLGYIWLFLNLLNQEDSEKRSWFHIIGLVLCGAGALYSHNLAGFGLLVPNIYLLLRRDRQRLGRLILFQVLILLLFIPWLVFLPAQLDKIQTAFWTPKPGFVEVFQAILMMTVNLPLPDNLMLIGSILGISAFVLSLFTLFRSRLDSAPKLFFTVWLFLAPCMLFVVSYLMRPVFVTRGFLIAVYGFLAISGVAITHAPNKVVQWGLVALFVGSSLIGLYSTITQSEFPRSPFVEVGTAIQAENPNALIIHENKLSYFPMVYLFPDLNQVFLADAEGSANDTLAVGTQSALRLFPANSWRDVIHGEQEFIFVTFEQANSEYSELGYLENPIITEMRQEYQRVDLETIGDIVVYRLQR